VLAGGLVHWNEHLKGFGIFKLNLKWLTAGALYSTFHRIGYVVYLKLFYLQYFLHKKRDHMDGLQESLIIEYFNVYVEVFGWQAVTLTAMDLISSME